MVDFHKSCEDRRGLDLPLSGVPIYYRRCAACGHVGCCDNSPSRHAALHFRRTGHPIIASFEPGDEWMYDYRSENYVKGQPLAPPRWHPDDQAIPGPEDRVPPDWESYLT